MKPWWRDQPLSDNERCLLDAVRAAHHEASFRPNTSTVAVASTADASNDASKAIAAAILTLGYKHAPLESTYEFLAFAYPSKHVQEMLQAKTRIPGWGGTFQQDSPDQIWEQVHQRLQENFSPMANKIDTVTKELHRHGKMLYPNGSAYTAATAIILGLRQKGAVYLFISSRLEAWFAIALKRME